MEDTTNAFVKKNTEIFVNLDNNNTQILVKSSKIFLENIFHFVMMSIKSEKLSLEKGEYYMNEFLHSIFFLGFINRPKIYPKDVLNGELETALRRRYPDAFQIYKTQLPSRPPYSVLLDLVVEVTGDQNETAVLDQLWKLNAKMCVSTLQKDGAMCQNDFTLASTVVSYTFFKDSTSRTRNYFGASVACKGKVQRQIFIDLSCIKTWNQNVAFAVCLAYNRRESIPLPEFVHSVASHMRSGPPQGSPNSSTEIVQRYCSKPPCEKCLKVFPNVKFSPPPKNTRKRPPWEYGNCAECEAISKLLNSEAWVREKVSHFDANVFNEFLKQRKERLVKNLGNNQFEF